MRAKLASQPKANTMTYPDIPTNNDAPLTAWRDGAIANIRFNRPAALNAIDVDMAQGMLDACRAIAADKSVRVVVLSGAGRAFMAGGDLPTLRSEPIEGPKALIGRIHPALEILAALPVPVLASVQGAVAGAGLGIMLACDLAIAADNARFSIAYPLIGTSADCASSWGLAKHLGLRQALEIALLAEPVDATNALRLGLVNRVVTLAELEAATQAMADRLAASATVALGQLKRLLRTAGERDFEGQLAAEADAFLVCAQTDDFREGVSAFLDKRRATFKGR
ncbi:MAG: Enoyl-CoA hydratase [Rhizobacter sp.]|nr:Enoyl-CoA hydratase [Rhizobacter sp.]